MTTNTPDPLDVVIEDLISKGFGQIRLIKYGIDDHFSFSAGTTTKAKDKYQFIIGEGPTPSAAIRAAIEKIEGEK